jgi:hypothetical protein
MMDKPGLNAWIVNQHVQAALSLAPDTPAEEKEKRILNLASEYAARASRFGGRLHEAIEFKLKGLDQLPDDTLTSDFPFIWGVFNWLNEHPIIVEELEFDFANPDKGYGGRIDCIGAIDIGEGKPHRCIIDWKTQATEPGKSFRIYPEHGMQLWAYWNGSGDSHPEHEDTLLFNLLISSTEPGRIEPYIWLDKERYGKGFNHCLGLYYLFGQGRRLLAGDTGEDTSSEDLD